MKIPTLYTLCFGLICVGTGCSPKLVYRLNNLQKSETEKIAILCNDSDKETKKIIEATLKVSDDGAPDLILVDGVAARAARWYDSYPLYNNTWQGGRLSFMMELPSGKHVLEVSVAMFQRVYSGSEVIVEFFAEAGHKYSLRQNYQLESALANTWRWYPILIDQTSKRIIYPSYLDESKKP